MAFDWNGTLLSDTKTCLSAENKALVELGAKAITMLKFRQSFDIPIIKYWKTIGLTEGFLDEKLFLLEEAYHKYYENSINHARTRAGAREALKWLLRFNIKAVIYSNHNVPNIHKHLVRLKIEKYIDSTLARPSASDHTQIHARAKEKYLQKYVNQYRFKPSEVISVGDTEEEIEIGKSFGFYTVAISGGYNTTARLKKHKPDFLVHSLKELIPIVKKINR